MTPSPESIPMARTVGFWLAGFAIPMLAGWFLLRRARAPARRPATACTVLPWERKKRGGGDRPFRDRDGGTAKRA